MVRTDGADTLFAAVTDRQNSLTAVMDAATGQVERYAYKPWGMRRDAEDWTKNVLSDHPSRFSRGYCMHEHLSEFGIIDMGGATAYIGGEIGGAISRVAGDWLSGIASPVLRNALPNMIGGGVSGFAVGAGFSLFGGASFKEAMSEGGKGAAFGAALGAISGTVKGIRYGRENGVNPWTGASLAKPAYGPSNLVADNGGSYSVYQGRDPLTGEVKYVGITKRDPQARFYEHLHSNSPRADLLYNPIAGGLSKTNAHIWEQNLINQYGLDNLYNQINSIAPKYWPQYNIKP